jgi:tetratricopeptide (TPR) repeat protein
VARHDKLAEDGNVAEAVPFMVRAAKVFDTELGDREQAFAAAQIAFEEDVTNPEAIAALEAITGASSKWNDLLKTTMESYTAEPAGPRKTQLGLHAAKWYGLELGHPEWAIPIYTQILAAEPGNLHALRSQGELYRRLGQWQPLAKTLQRAVEVARSPEDRRAAHVQLGEGLREEPEAAGAGGGAVPLGAGDRRDRRRGPRGARAGARRRGGLARPRRGAAPPRGVGHRSRRGRRALRMRVGSVLEDRIGDLEGAAAEYATVLSADPTNLAAMRGLEGIYARLGRSQELLAVLEQQLEVVSTERERIKLLTRIGEMLEEEFVRPALAIERFERVLEIDPSHDPSLRALERLYRHTGQWNELIATLERHLTATGERRDRVPVFLQMGRVYADEKRDVEHAEDAFLNVLQIDPRTSTRSTRSRASTRRAATGTAPPTCSSSSRSTSPATRPRPSSCASAWARSPRPRWATSSARWTSTRPRSTSTPPTCPPSRRCAPSRRGARTGTRWPATSTASRRRRSCRAPAPSCSPSSAA